MEVFGVLQVFFLKNVAIFTIFQNATALRKDPWALRAVPEDAGGGIRRVRARNVGYRRSLAEERRVWEALGWFAG